MKDQAAYHLLLVTVRRFAKAGSCDLKFSEALQSSLTSQHKTGWFTFGWSYQGNDYSLDVPGDTFGFYVKGDTGRQNENDRDLRWKNAREAEAVISRMANVSNASLKFSNAEEVTTAQIMRKEQKAKLQWMLSALLFAALSFIVMAAFEQSWAHSLMAFVTVFSANLLAAGLAPEKASGFSHGFARQSITTIGVLGVYLSLGSPPYLETIIGATTLLLLLGERQPGLVSKTAWFGAGATLSAVGAFEDKIFLLIPILFGSLVLILGFLIHSNVDRLQATVFAAGLASGLALMSVGGIFPPASTPALETSLAPLHFWASLCIGAVFVACMIALLLFGIQRSIAPWFLSVLASLAAFSVLLSGPSGALVSQLSLAGLAGLAAVWLWDVYRLNAAAVSAGGS